MPNPRLIAAAREAAFALATADPMLSDRPALATRVKSVGTELHGE